ncbi:hypothetical protein [Paraburkholderia sp. A1RO-5]
MVVGRKPLLTQCSEKRPAGNTGRELFFCAMTEAAYRAPAPHVLYGDDGPVDPREIKPITWTVREFVLVDSCLGKTRYDTKGRWLLKCGGPSD